MELIDVERLDPLQNAVYGSHIIKNQEGSTGGTCAKCGAKFFWDGMGYIPISKKTDSQCGGSD